MPLDFDLYRAWSASFINSLILLQNLSFSKRLFIFKLAQHLSWEITAYLQKFFSNDSNQDWYVFDFEVESAHRAELLKDSFFSFLFKAQAPFTIDRKRKEYTLRDLAVSLRYLFQCCA